MATMESLAATMAELTSSMGTMFAKYGQAEQAHSEVLTRIDNMQNQFTQKFDASQREFKEVNADFTQKLSEFAKSSEASTHELKAKILEAEEKKHGKELPNSDEEVDPRGIDPAAKAWQDYLPGKGNPSGSSEYSPGKGNHSRSDDRPERNRILEEKSFRRVEKFLTGEPEWQEFAFDVLVTTRALNPDIAARMEEIMKAKEVTMDYLESLYRSDRELSKASKELYEVLCQLTGGQAKSLLRGVDGSDGLRAWRVLHTTYARDTLARTLRLYREVINPTQCATADQIITGIGKWETKLKELERHTCSKNAHLPEMVKLAALTEICTNDIRDLVYQNADSGHTFEQIREKIIGWTSNRIAASAANMDIGHIDQSQCYQCEPYGQEFTGEFQEVNMAGKCYTCGVVGHPARLCPSKGQGKGHGGKGGFKGGGKGGMSFNPGSQPYNPKGMGKGGQPHNPGYNPKGSGKGYQGFCFNCGKQGHKAAECRGPRRANSVEAEADEEEVKTREIGGIWLMGHVGKVVETRNRFQNLANEDHEESEELEEDRHPFTQVKDRKRKPTFTGNAKINLTTRNLRNVTGKPTGTKPQKLLGEEVIKEKLIASAERTNSAVCQMTFHLTDANKMLASVNKMTEVGNRVDFNKRKSFIESPDGKRAYLRKRGGVYVLDVVFFDGEKAVRGEVIIDSGAADNVMPKDMLTGITTKEKEPGTRFVAADGGELGNYGRKDVQFCPLEFWEGEFGAPFQGLA
jgi:hypothetical protein